MDKQRLKKEIDYARGFDISVFLLNYLHAELFEKKKFVKEIGLIGKHAHIRLD